MLQESPRCVLYQNRTLYYPNYTILRYSLYYLPFKKQNEILFMQECNLLLSISNNWKDHFERGHVIICLPFGSNSPNQMGPQIFQRGKVMGFIGFLKSKNNICKKEGIVFFLGLTCTYYGFITWKLLMLNVIKNLLQLSLAVAICYCIYYT